MRRQARFYAVLAAVTGIALAATGCSTPKTTAVQTDKTLKFDFSFSMQSADPDVFFQDQGLNVEMSAYEGLIKNSPTGALEPSLATSWNLSPDGLTLTMNLRHGVKFHDGTPMNAAAVAFSAERRLKVNSGPALTLYGMKSVQATGPYTVVFHLTAPNADFIPEFASPWGLKIVSPTAVKAHEIGNDLGQKWLSSHDAGTGPYLLTSYSANAYSLTRFDGYWGHKPAFGNVQIKVVSDFTSQVLQLESGQLDLMIKGVPPRDLPSLQSKGFTIHSLVTDNRTALFLNPAAPAFATQAGRLAVAAAIDRGPIVSQVYGKYATLATQMYPANTLPASLARYPISYDPAAAKKYVSSLPASSRTVTLQYVDDDPNNQPLALLIASALQNAGLHVEVSPVTQPQTFSYPTKPSARPDMLIVDATSRGAFYPDSYPRSFLSQDGALSYFQPTAAAPADKIMNQARATVDQVTATALYGKAGDMYAETGLTIPIADEAQVTVARPGLGNFQHEYLALNSINLDVLNDG